MYSGDAAGRTYRWLAESHPAVDLVVIFGSHRGPRGPNTVFTAQGWSTPLGPLATAQAVARDVLAELGAPWSLQEEPVDPRQPDNAVELHLPFARYFFPEAELLMLGVEASARAEELGRQVGAIVERHGRRAVYIASTDLTHYGPNYRFEPHGPGSHGVDWVRNHNDRAFIERVLAWDAQGAVAHANEHQSACGPGAVAACLGALQQGHPKLVDHYLSCDVRPSSSFVGYAGILL